MEPKTMTRKEFVVLTLTWVGTSAAGAAGCSSEKDSNGNPTGNAGNSGSASCDNPLPSSQVPGDSHTHTVMVPASALDATSGQTFTTSSANSHTHMITLSANSLTTIKGGGSVTVTSTTNSGHAHDYTVRCT
jgi:hypothetical protein